MNQFLLSRRTMLGGAVGAMITAAANPLLTGFPARAGSVGAGVDAGQLTGFRVTLKTRLSVLESDAGLAPLPPDSRFRRWALARVRRLEELHDLSPTGRHDEPWRDWVNDRVTPIEQYLPAPLRFPFYTHLPLETPSSGYGPLLRQRIAEGSCNGIFLYGGPTTPMAPTAALDSITGSGGPVPILMSPKNVSDPVKLAAWMDYWAARPAWIPYVRVAYWQEFQGDFGGAGQPPVSAWHAGVTTLADAADRVGIASAAHAETWHLHPSQPHGGIPRLLEFLQPVIYRFGGGVSWSVFVFNQESGGANEYVEWMNDFMAAYFPHSSYGVGAYGDSVPPETPADDPLRVARAGRIASMFTDLEGSRARYGGYYGLPRPSNPEWSFWDGLVSDESAKALAELGDGDRLGHVRRLDRRALRASSRSAGTAHEADD